MDPVIYLEPDEEITSVVEKLKRSKSPVVGIVAPRNAVLLQSVVNLKLLKRQAAILKKEISLVTGDKIGQNLALRTGLTVYANVHDAEPLEPPKGPRPDSFVEDEQKSVSSSINNFKVHHYDEKNDIVDASLSDEDNIPASNFQSRPINQPKSTIPAEIASEEPIDEVKESVSEAESDENDEEVESKALENPPIKPKKIEELVINKNLSPLKISRSKTNYLKIVIVFGIFIVVAGIISFLALSSIVKGSVVINVASESVKQDLTFQVSKDRSTVDSIKNILPGRLTESEQSVTQKFKATGTKDIGEKATGKITISNQGAGSQSFEAGTALRSKDGIIFKANKAFTVPGAKSGVQDPKTLLWTNIPGTAIIEVTANNVGDSGNIDITSYSITGYSFVFGTGTAMTGGATKEVTIVSKDDLEKATNTVTKDLIDKSLIELKKKSGGAIYLDKAVKTQAIDTTSDIEVLGEATEFSLTVKIKSSVLVFDKSKLDTLIEDNLKSKIAADKILLAADTKDLNLIVVSSEPDAGIMKISATTQGKIVPNLDKTKIQSDLAGKTLDEVNTYFHGKSDITSVKTTLDPSWLAKKLPTSKQKITIDIITQN